MVDILIYDVIMRRSSLKVELFSKYLKTMKAKGMFFIVSLTSCNCMKGRIGGHLNLSQTIVL